MEENKLVRTAREIKVDESFLDDVNLNVKIGAAEKRNRPETIYIEISFWIKNTSDITDNSYLRKKLRRDIKNIYMEDLKDLLVDNFYFPNHKENMFIINIPDNINYNDKKNFVSIELYLHTLNNHIKPSESYALSKKKSSELYNEALSVAKVICDSDVLNSKKEFDITKKK